VSTPSSYPGRLEPLEELILVVKRPLQQFAAQYLRVLLKILLCPHLMCSRIFYNPFETLGSNLSQWPTSLLTVSLR
jgi:hypothetical protein